LTISFDEPMLSVPASFGNPSPLIHSWGYLNSATSTTYPAELLTSFRQGLSDAGYIEGKNLKIEYRWAEGDYDRLPRLAQELVTRRVDVIAATGGIVSARAAKAATATIPIVFTMGDDPVTAGIVASFSRPGGNITGISFFVVELGTKLLQLATELVPNLSPIGVLTNPKRPSFEPIRQAVENAAQALGRKLIAVEAANDADFEPAFAALAGAQAGALVITSDPLYLDRRDRLVGLAARLSIPTVCAWPDYVAAGALMSYGPSLPDVYQTPTMDKG